MQPRRDFGIIALVVAFAILAAAVLGTLLTFPSQQRAQSWVIHTLTVQGRLNTVLARLQDAETGQRGYIITRDVQYLAPYFEGTRRLADDIESLRASTADNPEQLARVQELKQFA